MSNGYLTSKPRYEILDGLRGVAAILVLIYHICETHWGQTHQPVAHGYLAVDFFFVLSGFVIGYAYDDRWGKGLSVGEFFRRRIIRLHPMVILSALINLFCMFLLVGGVIFPHMSTGYLLLAWLMTMLMIPGLGGQVFLISGTQWTLFYEYLANVLYATVVRRMSDKALYVTVGIFGLWMFFFLVAYPASGGVMAGGWEFTAPDILRAFTRLLFPFFGGLALFRINRLIRVRGGFLWASLLVMAILLFPHLDGPFWLNGLYEALVIMLLFPLIINIGAGSPLSGKRATRICTFLGEISFPLYISHYGYIFLYMQYVFGHDYSFNDAWPVALLVFAASLLTAYLSLKLYDIPVRNWLRKHWIEK